MSWLLQGILSAGALFTLDGVAQPRRGEDARIAGVTSARPTDGLNKPGLISLKMLAVRFWSVSSPVATMRTKAD